jgi:hypothetical protein
VSGPALDRVRAVADAVLYEGYLLYPYHSTSAKNQVRWQFGVLGPPSAAAAGLGEECELAVQCLLAVPARPGPDARPAQLQVILRFLQLQRRGIERARGPAAADGFTPVRELTSGDRTWLAWDEATERELPLGPFPVGAGGRHELTVEVPGGHDVELLHDDDALVGRLVRSREPLAATVTVGAAGAGGGPDGEKLLRLEVAVRNRTAGAVADRDAATARSFLGAHLVLVADEASFVSVVDPPAWAQEAAAGCEQRRCWPVLAGDEGETRIVLASPIILYDHPAVAPESAGALFDSTEIDEILTLRVMTLTDEEKAAARATDPRAAAVIDRCDGLSPEALQGLHGILRDPRADVGAFPPFPVPSEQPGGDGDVPWWDPAADASVRPELDAVVVGGVAVRRGSLVRLRPTRRADAQDLFYAGQEARVTAVLGDVDGDTHVAVVLVDDPAAELHEWYGRYLYFAPEELEPLPGQDVRTDERRESGT